MAADESLAAGRHGRYRSCRDERRRSGGRGAVMDGWAGLGTIDPVSEKKPVGLSPVYPGKVRCLGCERQFESPSKRHVRLCPRCRGRK
jgi:hypothetical protein